jgi:hypothetical protein
LVVDTLVQLDTLGASNGLLPSAGTVLGNVPNLSVAASNALNSVLLGNAPSFGDSPPINPFEATGNDNLSTTFLRGSAGNTGVQTNTLPGVAVAPSTFEGLPPDTLVEGDGVYFEATTNGNPSAPLSFLGASADTTGLQTNTVLGDTFAPLTFEGFPPNTVVAGNGDLATFFNP